MKLKGLRWWIITLIFIATVINYIDRTAFALLWPDMGKDLGMDNSDYALMLNVLCLHTPLVNSCLDVYMIK